MRKLIKKPRQLLSVEVEKHWYESDGFRTIRITTDKGTYEIHGCSNCSAIYWRKVSALGEEYE